MHSFLVGALYVAIVLTPCVIALFSDVDREDDSSETDVLQDGFI